LQIRLQATKRERARASALDRHSFVTLRTVILVLDAPPDMAVLRRHYPEAALAGIKASVNAVRPHHNPELANETIAAFARTWADPAHWVALDEMDRRRRSK